MCTHMDSFGYYYICPYGFFWMLLYIHIDYFECDFNIGYFKYPNISFFIPKLPFFPLSPTAERVF